MWHARGPPRSRTWTASGTNHTMDLSDPGFPSPPPKPWPLSQMEAAQLLDNAGVAQAARHVWHPSAILREPIRPLTLHEIIAIAVGRAQQGGPAGAYNYKSCVEAIRLLDWFRTSYAGYNAAVLSRVSTPDEHHVRHLQFVTTATSPLVFALLWRTTGEDHDGTLVMHSRLHRAVCTTVVRWLWTQGAALGPVREQHTKDLLLDCFTFEMPPEFGVTLLSVCLRGAQDPAARLTAPNGVSFMWLALTQNRFDMASLMVLLGAPLHSSPNLLYSNLGATAFDLTAKWAIRLLTRRAAFITLLGATLDPNFNTHPAADDGDQNPWPLLRHGGNARPRMLIAGFLGLATGKFARRLRLAHERLGPILAERRRRNEVLGSLAESHSIYFERPGHSTAVQSASTWSMLTALPPLQEDELPALLPRIYPQPVDPLTLLPID